MPKIHSTESWESEFYNLPITVSFPQTASDWEHNAEVIKDFIRSLLAQKDKKWCDFHLGLVEDFVAQARQDTIKEVEEIIEICEFHKDEIHCGCLAYLKSKLETLHKNKE